MSKPNGSMDLERWNGSLNQLASGPVSEPGKVKDQSNTSVFMGATAGRHEPAAASLPLFIDTLYKARDFDPL
ncbi:MAG: hypothetical protein J7621_16360 [Niastella sp.]|nr:hypothetical protein [Niastella sp.]